MQVENPMGKYRIDVVAVAEESIVALLDWFGRFGVKAEREGSTVKCDVRSGLAYWMGQEGWKIEAA